MDPTRQQGELNETIIWAIEKYCLLKLTSFFLCFKAYCSFLSFLLIKMECFFKVVLEGAFVLHSFLSYRILFAGHPNMGGPMQRMTPPRGMVPLGPQVPSTDRYLFLLVDVHFCYVTLTFHRLVLLIPFKNKLSVLQNFILSCSCTKSKMKHLSF